MRVERVGEGGGGEGRGGEGRGGEGRGGGKHRTVKGRLVHLIQKSVQTSLPVFDPSKNSKQITNYISHAI